MPAQHRDFFTLLPYIFVGAVDREGWPLATILTGKPGFVHTPDAVTLRIDALPSPHDPAAGALIEGREIGLLGIDLSTRRRNRANGRIATRDAGGLTIGVTQSFGNCPQYIQLREVAATAAATTPAEQLTGLDDEARAMIVRADTTFVATRSRQDIDMAGGADISHRGGKPGFIRVEGNRLTIPDFRGNRYFNTLGNLIGEPRASLLFVDFSSGDILQLQGLAEVDWSDAADRFEGAERLWHFTVTRGWRRRNALNLRWSFLGYSPMTERTGQWEDATASRN